MSTTKKSKTRKSNLNLLRSADLKTADDYYAFFKGIPASEWTTEFFTDDKGRHCAAGHIQAEVVPQARGVVQNRLTKLFTAHNFPHVTRINDGITLDGLRTPEGRGPKARILNALKVIRKEQANAQGDG